MIPLLVLSDVAIVGSIVGTAKFWPQIRNVHIPRPQKSEPEPPAWQQQPVLICSRCLMGFALLHPYHERTCHCCVDDLRVDQDEEIAKRRLERKLRDSLPEFDAGEAKARIDAMLAELAALGDDK